MVGKLRIVLCLLLSMSMIFGTRKDDIKKMFEYISDNNYDDLKKLVDLYKNDADFINARNSHDETPLMVAAQHGKKDIIQLFLDNPKTDVNATKDFKTMLIWATENNKPGHVKYLLTREDLDVNKGDKYGVTPLMTASENGYTDIVNLLLNNKKTKVNQSNIQGTALMRATVQKKPEVVKLLLQHPDIDVNAKDTQNMTALMKSIALSDTECLKLLLEHPKINVNAKGLIDRTVLMNAAILDYDTSVQLLLTHKNINLDEKDDHGNTALDLAKKNETLGKEQEIIYKKENQFPNASKIVKLLESKIGNTDVIDRFAKALSSIY